MTNSETKVSKKYSDREGDCYRALVAAVRSGNIPDIDILAQLPLYTPRVVLAHQLFLDEIYRQILDVPGAIAEFGVRWGRNLASFHSLRSIYESNNMSRHIYGFDTFAGFPSISERDGHDPVTQVGGLDVPEGYLGSLEEILYAHQGLSMRPDHKRFHLVKGDVCETLPKQIEDNPHLIFALCYIDVDLYEPSKAVIKAVWERTPKGGILAFDEINLDLFPGETLAMLECIDIAAHTLKRSKVATYTAYVVK